MSERSEHSSAWRGVPWLLGALLLFVTAIPLPAAGPWPGVRPLLLAAVAAALAGEVFSRAEWEGARLRAFLLRPRHLLPVLFAGWTALSLAAAQLPPPVSAWGRAEALRHGSGAALCLALAAGLRVRRSLGSITALLSAAGGLAGAVAFLQFRTGTDDSAAGSFGNVQLLAAVLALLLPLALVTAGGAEAMGHRLLGLAAAGLAGAGLLATGSRSAWAGLAAGLALVGGALLWQRRAPITRRHLAVVALSLLAVLGFGAAVATQPELQRLVAYKATSLAALDSDASGRWRVGMWTKALRLAAARPWLGWGPGTYPLMQAVYPHPAAPGLSQLEVLAAGPTLRENAHNTYLQLAAEVGIPGALLYLAAALAGLAAALRAVPHVRRGPRRLTLLAAAGGLLAHLVSALGSPAWEFAECSLFYWTLLGLSLAVTRSAEPDFALPTSPRPSG